MAEGTPLEPGRWAFATAYGQFGSLPEPGSLGRILGTNSGKLGVQFQTRKRRMDSRNGPRPDNAWLQGGRRIEIQAFQVFRSALAPVPGVAFARLVKLLCSAMLLALTEVS